MRTKPRVGAIDGLRAVAVLAVVGEHALANVVPAAWLRCGARGVDLFFVLSGFCLAYPFLATYRCTGELRISYAGFVVRRLIRVAPPYIVALVAFAALSFTSFGFPTAASIVPPHAVADRLAEFGRDAAFLTGPEPSFNASFWTLGVEMRWYVLFPLLLALYARSRAAFLALGCACYVIYFLTPWGIADLGTLPCFMLGIVAADLRVAAPAVERALGRAALPTLAAAVWLQVHASGVDHGEPIWHLAAFCCLAASRGGWFARGLAWRAVAFTGAASYGIYLIHLPILDALERVGAGPVSSALVAVAAGIAFYAGVERPFLDETFRDRVAVATIRGLGSFVPRASTLEIVETRA